MNLDGSPGVDVDLSAGGRLGWLTPLAWSLGLLGGTLILGAALLVVYGARPPGPPSRQLHVYDGEEALAPMTGSELDRLTCSGCKQGVARGARRGASTGKPLSTR